ncbi:MAG: Hsp33 family molecular chaperone HslO [Spirochaetota bacterium]
MRLAPIDDPVVTSHLDSIAEDGMDIFLLSADNYRGAVLNGTRLVNQMRANHELGILETLLLGHSYIAAGLLTSLVKGNDRILLAIECDGPVRGLAVESSAHGEVRGYLRNHPIPVEEPVESFDLAPYIGNGTLTVTRHLEMARNPFSGHVKLQYGNLAKDLANYFVVSEQLPTALSLSIQFDREGRVSGAGGLFIQSLPGSDRSGGAALEDRVKELPSLGSMFAQGDTPAHVINTHFHDFGPNLIGTRTIEFSCRCSKEVYAAYLSSLPAEELDDIRENGPFPLKITCHNCNSTYIYQRDEVESIAEGDGG